MASNKAPPSWDPASENVHHCRDWLADVRLWAEATDLPWANQGLAVALQLGGLAKE